MNTRFLNTSTTRYTSTHWWLRSNYGKACRCDNKGCKVKPKRFEWALKKGCLYEKKRENFMMLCPRCHRKYDGNCFQKGGKLSEETKKKISESQTLRKIKEQGYENL